MSGRRGATTTPEIVVAVVVIVVAAAVAVVVVVVVVGSQDFEADPELSPNFEADPRTTTAAAVTAAAATTAAAARAAIILACSANRVQVPQNISFSIKPTVARRSTPRLLTNIKFSNSQSTSLETPGCPI